ncbi:hypothetical protein [Paenibacillus odorifer]|uniref:hypothetical protein n=1 Tax=Paenibacillus odorifer TaxID=189426 RepID=UPI00096FD635|nr:hypothetical protein [Paenibacillus odorifer]OMD93535.1 hypothetical protein BSK67_16585 [Paenibacillus odorifer]
MGKRKICPRCGSNAASRFIYGLIHPDDLDNIRGNYVLGGCVIEEDAPTTQCDTCAYRWGGKQLNLQGDISKFTARTSDCWGFGAIQIEADFQLGTITYSQFEGPFSIPEIKQSIFTNNKKDLLIHTLEYSDFIDWIEQYKNNMVIDGRQWFVKLEFTDGSVIEKSGRNAYPGRWKYFCKKLSELANATFS